MSNNIGIGVNNPQEKLQIDGGILLGAAVNANDGTICFNGTDIMGRTGSSWKSLTGLGLKGDKGDSGPRGRTGFQGGDSNWPKNDDGRLYYLLNVGIGVTGTTSDGKLYVKADAIDSLALKIYGKSSLDGDLAITGTLTKSDINGGNDLIAQIVTNKTDVALKSNLASPTFTGTPLAPTASSGTNTTQLATTAFVHRIIDGAPAALDTLKELSEALGDDADYAATTTTALGNRYTKTEADAITDLLAPLANPALTGNPTAPTQSAGDNSTKISTTAYVKTAVDAIPEGILTEANSVAVYDGGLTLGVGNESAADGTIRVKDGNLEFRVGGAWERLVLYSQLSVSASIVGKFISHTFTTCRSTGRIGPTLDDCKVSYARQSWSQTTDFFRMDSYTGVQEWKVPDDGTYNIQVFGAQGGVSGNGVTGGLGAYTGGNIVLTAGTWLYIIVGQQGDPANNEWFSNEMNANNGGGGGGGGSFVSQYSNYGNLSNSTILIASGGGSGSCVESEGWPNYKGIGGTHASHGTSGRKSDYYGGTNGDDGGHGNGGKGWNSIKGDPRGKELPSTWEADYSGNGGFGGGGCAFVDNTQLSGGGGGYSGGGGTPLFYAGGGGGSKHDSNFTNQTGIRAVSYTHLTLPTTPYE